MEATDIVSPTVVIGGQQFELSRGFLGVGERSVVGYEMLKRAEAMGNLADPFHSESFLVNQKDIQVECRQFVVVFAGKVRKGPRGCIGVVCLGWCNHFQRWIPFTRWCGWGFSYFFLVARLVPQLTFDKQLASPSL